MVRLIKETYHLLTNFVNCCVGGATRKDLRGTNVEFDETEGRDGEDDPKISSICLTRSSTCSLLALSFDLRCLLPILDLILWTDTALDVY